MAWPSSVCLRSGPKLWVLRNQKLPMMRRTITILRNVIGLSLFGDDHGCANKGAAAPNSILSTLSRNTGGAGKFRKDALNLDAGCIERAGIMNHVIGKRDFFLVGDLGGNAAACVGFERVPIGRTGKLREAIDVAGDSKFDGRSDEDDAIKAPSPAGSRTPPVGFEDECGFDDDNRLRILSEDFVGPFLLGFNHGRVNDEIKLGETVLTKCEIGEQAAIEIAVGTDDTLAEVLDDRVVSGMSGSHELAAERVGADDVRAERVEES